MALPRIGATTAFGSVVKALQTLARRRRLQDVATTKESVYKLRPAVFLRSGRP
jgi:hypothetical protein